MQTLIGKKIGMTRVYDADGVQVPVTVVQVGPCTVVQRKSKDADGYEAVQLGFGEQKESRLGKPLQGHFKKAGAKPAKVLREVRVDAAEGAQPGDVVVASCGAYVERAVCGEIMANLAMKRGLAGFVIDGAVRDARALPWPFASI